MSCIFTFTAPNATANNPSLGERRGSGLSRRQRKNCKKRQKQEAAQAAAAQAAAATTAAGAGVPGSAGDSDGGSSTSGCGGGAGGGKKKMGCATYEKLGMSDAQLYYWMYSYCLGEWHWDC